MNRVFTANFSIKLNGMGESYNRMALFCQEYYGNEKLHRSIETEQMIITSVLRGMQFNSKNARFQFPRILQLPALKKMILSDAFNEEVCNVTFRFNSLKYFQYFHFADVKCSRMDVSRLDSPSFIEF